MQKIDYTLSFVLLITIIGISSVVSLSVVKSTPQPDTTQIVEAVKESLKDTAEESTYTFSGLFNSFDVYRNREFTFALTNDYTREPSTIVNTAVWKCVPLQEVPNSINIHFYK